MNKARAGENCGKPWVLGRAGLEFWNNEVSLAPYSSRNVTVRNSYKFNNKVVCQEEPVSGVPSDTMQFGCVLPNLILVTTVCAKFSLSAPHNWGSKCRHVKWLTREQSYCEAALRPKPRYLCTLYLRGPILTCCWTYVLLLPWGWIQCQESIRYSTVKQGAKWLCQRLGINDTECLGWGAV